MGQSVPSGFFLPPPKRKRAETLGDATGVFGVAQFSKVAPNFNRKPPRWTNSNRATTPGRFANRMFPELERVIRLGQVVWIEPGGWSPKLPIWTLRKSCLPNLIGKESLALGNSGRLP